MTAISYNVMAEQGFSARLFRAWHLLQIRKEGTATQEWLGKKVGKVLGVSEPISQSAVSRWFRGATPDLETIGAIAKALEVDPGWLAFGDNSQAPSPEDMFRARFRPTKE
jgi:transcriptional regulator with XRE-family HTH domain